MIRKKDSNDDTRPYSTIRYTPNNPESSRSTYIQAIKVNDSYHLVLDRPGEEDPYSTFNIKSKYDMVCLSNPIFAVASYLSKSKFKDYPIANSETVFKLFNAIGFTNFKSKTLVEHLANILNGVDQEKFQVELFPHTNFKSSYRVEENVLNEYISKRFLADLDDFTLNNESQLKSFINDLDKMFSDKLPKSVYEYLKDIHKNEEWLNFKISVDNFEDYGHYTNMYIHGISSNQIAIKDLFPMQNIKTILEKHRRFDSKFMDIFLADNFFNQLCCPMLGWLLKEFSMLMQTKLTKIDNNYDAGSVVNDFYLITPSGVNIKTGGYDELKFVDFSVKLSNAKFLDSETQIQLGFEHFMGLSKFGNQSFMNSWSSIASFLLSSALYFAIFKNSNYVDYYDKKIQHYLGNYSHLNFRDALNFYEAVSINEINANQQDFMGKNPLNSPEHNEPIKLNSLMYNTMYLMSDLILPNIPYTRFNRNKRFTTNYIIDMTFENQSPLHFRLDVPFKILPSILLNNEDILDKLVGNSNNPTLFYSMTQRYMKDVEWIVTKNEWEKKSKPFLVMNNTTIIKLAVFNSVKIREDSGGLSYFNIVNSI